METIERFNAKVTKTDECWTWIGAKIPAGYGAMRIAGQFTYAHRYSYEHEHGPVPDGMHLDHKCHTLDASCNGGADCKHRSCVNPDHLEPVTKKTNDHRGMSPHGINHRKTHCIRGHEFNEANTRRDRNGNRSCRACHAARQLARYYASRR